METEEHRREIGRDGSRFGEMNSRLAMGLQRFGDGRRLRAKDWVWSFISRFCSEIEIEIEREN